MNDRFSVTTSYLPPRALVQRAQELSQKLNAPYVPRDKHGRLFRTGEELWYIIGKDRESVRSAQTEIFVHVGMMKLKRGPGRGHPMLRAIAPLELPVPSTIVDATLGLGQDAFHMGIMLEANILGVEASPVILALLEEGTARLRRANDRWSEGVGRLSLVPGSAESALAAMGTSAHPVVFLDPMFESPLRSPPGWEVFRSLAVPTPLTEEALSQAVRVAADRVVLKVPRSGRAPAFCASMFNRRVCGRALDYWIIEKVLPDPVWEEPRASQRYPYRPARGSRK